MTKEETDIGLQETFIFLWKGHIDMNSHLNLVHGSILSYDLILIVHGSIVSYDLIFVHGLNFAFMCEIKNLIHGLNFVFICEMQNLIHG